VALAAIRGEPEVSLSFEGFQKLKFPEHVRQVGMSIITVTRDEATMVPSSEPFRGVTDQKYISIVQQSKSKRDVLAVWTRAWFCEGWDRMCPRSIEVDTYGPIPQISIHRQDGQNVTLTDKSDTQNYLDSNNTPFLEPSLELSMVDAVENGAFDLILLPSRGSTLFSWQFIVLRQSTSELRFYNFSADENGLFDINGKRKNFSENYKILPDSSCFITRAGSDQPLSLQGPPRAVVYVKHEKVVQPDGTSIGVKRAARFLLTQTVLNDKTVATATFDSAVGVDGTMARLSGPISSSEIEPSVFDLFFNGVSYLQINPPASGDNPLAIKGPYSISFMICPAERGHNTTIFGGMDTCDPTIAAPFVRIVDGDKLQVGFGNHHPDGVRHATDTQLNDRPVVDFVHDQFGDLVVFLTDRRRRHGIREHPL